MKKLFALSLALILLLSSVSLLSACGGKETPPDETTAQTTPSGDPVTQPGTTPSGDPVTQPGTTPSGDPVTQPETEKPAPTTLTAAEAAAAIEKTMSDPLQRYAFVLTLDGTINYKDYSKTMTGKISGDVQYDRTNDVFSYKKVTEGSLISPQTTYAYSKDTDRITVALNSKGALANASVLPTDKQDPLTTASPFIAIVRAMDEKNVADLKKETSGEYGWSCRMILASDNALLQKAFGQIEGLGLLLTVGKVELDNPDGGVTLFFNVNGDGRLTDYTMSTKVRVPFAENASVVLTLTYTQSKAEGDVKVQVPDNILFDKAAIAAELKTLADAYAALKGDNTYSLSLKARNEFDPGWNKLAIVDQMTSTLYKNGSAFNNSFTYKSHTEEDGKESYKYTIGNIQDGSVWLVSRKGSNKYEKTDAYTADERFDYLTDVILPDVSEIKCLAKYGSGADVSYDVFFTDDAVQTLVDKVLGYVNSNPAPEVIPVNNYVNKTACEITKVGAYFELKGGIPVKANCDLQIRYAPVGGDYRGQSITLDEVLELNVNSALAKAKKYESPKKAESTLGIGGLDFVD